MDRMVGLKRQWGAVWGFPVLGPIGPPPHRVRIADTVGHKPENVVHSHAIKGRWRSTLDRFWRPPRETPTRVGGTNHHDSLRPQTRSRSSSSLADSRPSRLRAIPNVLSREKASEHAYSFRAATRFSAKSQQKPKRPAPSISDARTGLWTVVERVTGYGKNVVSTRNRKGMSSSLVKATEHSEGVPSKERRDVPCEMGEGNSHTAATPTNSLW